MVDRKHKGRCKYCGELVTWDENYVRFIIVGQEPEHDAEEFGHIGCYLKEQIDFQGIVVDEKVQYWIDHP